MKWRALVVAAAMLAACDETPATAPVSSRVNAASAARNPHEVEAFCDVRFPANAPARREATGPYATMPASDRWRWLNVWATWCHPCVEEIPLISEWAARNSHGANAVELRYLSVDATDDVLAGYAAQHPQVRGSARLGASSDLPALLQALGLDAAAAIPIHAFYDPSGQLRCVRTGSIQESHFDIIKRMMRGE